MTDQPPRKPPSRAVGVPYPPYEPGPEYDAWIEGYHFGQRVLLEHYGAELRGIVARMDYQAERPQERRAKGAAA